MTIERYTMDKWRTLSEIVIPDGVTSIGFEAFRGFSNLEKVVIPDSVTTIGEGAFCECEKLSAVKLPDSVETIDLLAFYSTALTSVSLPKSVRTVGMRAFDCPVYVDEGNEWYSDIEGVLFNKDKTVLVSFPSENGPKTYFIPDVEKIGDGAFFGCTLDCLDIPDGVVEIGEQAFYEMEMPGFLDIPQSVQRIGDDAFIHPVDVYHYNEDWYIDDYAITLHVGAGEIEFKDSTFGNRLLYVPEDCYSKWEGRLGKVVYSRGMPVHRVRRYAK